MAKKQTKGNVNVCVIYARYSSHNQNDASIEQQVHECTTFAKERALHIVDIYSDRAVSGKTDRRPGFQRLMHDAESGKFAYVIAWKSNRMGRNMLQAMSAEMRLQELGVRTLYTSESFDDSAAGRFALRSMMNVNQFQIENMAEDIKRGMRANALECKAVNGTLGFGFKKGLDGRFELDPPKDLIVQEIFSRVGRGEPFVDISNDLNQRGIKTARGGKWNKNSFTSMLRNERYTGIFIYDDIRIDGGVPAIISKQLFVEVQEVLRMKKTVRGRHQPAGDYILTGKLYCDCGAPMVGVSGTSGTGAVHYYYSCNNARSKNGCKRKNVRRDAIEKAVLEGIQHHALNDDVIQWLAKSAVEYAHHQAQNPTVALLEDELSQTKKEIANVMKAIKMGIITDTTKGTLVALERNQLELSSKIAAEKADTFEVSFDELVAALELFRDGDLQDDRYTAKLISTFVRQVQVMDDCVKIIFSFVGKNHVEIPLDVKNLNFKAAVERSDGVRIASVEGDHQQKPFRFIRSGFFAFFALQEFCAVATAQ